MEVAVEAKSLVDFNGDSYTFNYLQPGAQQEE